MNALFPHPTPAKRGFAEAIATRLRIGLCLGIALVGAGAMLAATVAPALQLWLIGAVAAVTMAAAWLWAGAAGRHIGEPAEALAQLVATPAVDKASLPVLIDQINDRFAQAARQLSEMAETRDQADAANQAKSHFLANMSHELRTPLNAVIGYAMLLQEDAVESGNAAMAADLDRILASGRHLLAIINDVLDLSRMEAGKASVERDVVDIKALVRNAAAPFELPDVANGNVLVTDIGAEAGIMLADAAKLRQCLQILLGNAFKFTAGGTVTLSVGVDRTHANPVIGFAVSDTGAGITESQLPHLFDAFGADNHEEGPQGTGLGLAIAKRLAVLMGGDITVTSEPGKGSRFTLSLPFNTELSVDSAPASSPAGIDIPDDLDCFDRTALVIDDNPDAIDLMRRWLAPHGYGVIAAAEGESGLDAARRMKPNLIVLDVFMPGRSGYDVLEEIRSDATIHSTPVIMVTVDDDPARAMRAGANEYLTKPVTRERLHNALRVAGMSAEGGVLIVDDDPDAGDLVQRCVEQVGLPVRRAFDGAEAIAMVRQRPPSAIILDLAMPKMDGFQVLHSLSSDARLAEIPVLIVSARDLDSGERDQFKAAGYPFFAKGQASPRDIARNLKSMVSQ